MNDVIDGTLGLPKETPPPTTTAPSPIPVQIVLVEGPPGEAGPQGEPGPTGAAGFDAFTLTTSDFLMPAVNATVVVNVVHGVWAGVGQTVFVPVAGYMQVTATSAFTITLQNLDIVTNASVGTTITAGSTVSPAGSRGQKGGASSSVSNNFLQPNANSTVAVTVDTTEWMTAGQEVYVTGGGYYLVASVTSETVVSLQNLGYNSNANPGSTITASGAKVAPAGVQGLSSYTLTSGNFSQPAIGSTVNVAVGDSSWASVNQPVYVNGGGFYTVSAVPDGTHVTLKNTGAIGNAAVSATVTSPAIVGPGGSLAPNLPIEIPLVGGNFNSGASIPSSVGGRYIDLSGYPTSYSGVTRHVTFVADIESSSSIATAAVQLQNATDNETVTGSSLSTTNTAPTELSALLTSGSSSGNLKDGKFYLVQITLTGGSGSDRVTLTNARLVITYS